jgi:hypothetical protein
VKDLWRLLGAAAPITAVHVVVALRITLPMRVVVDANSRRASARVQVPQHDRVLSDLLRLPGLSAQPKADDHVRLV